MPSKYRAGVAACRGDGFDASCRMKSGLEFKAFTTRQAAEDWIMHADVWGPLQQVDPVGRLPGPLLIALAFGLDTTSRKAGGLRAVRARVNFQTVAGS